MKELGEMSEIELLQTHGAVITELMDRGVVSTRNNPIGDYTEWLVCRRLGLEKQGNSQAGFDAVGKDGTRYQIKGRQDARTSVQFSAIRNLDRRDFDAVIAVVFDVAFSIRFAVVIPYAGVPEFARYYEHTNAHNLILTDDVVNGRDVTDIRQELVGFALQSPGPVDREQYSSESSVSAAPGRAAPFLTSPPAQRHAEKRWPKSISIRHNLIGRGVIRRFEFNNVRYEVPHDALVQIVGEATPWLQSPSWIDNGGYSTSNPSAALLAKLRPFALNFSG